MKLHQKSFVAMDVQDTRKQDAELKYSYSKNKEEDAIRVQRQAGSLLNHALFELLKFLALFTPRAARSWECLISKWPL